MLQKTGKLVSYRCCGSQTKHYILSSDDYISGLDLSEDAVSVVIPVYNSEIFLKESVESALSQTYKNLEIIAVDDGSTDDSLKILNQFGDKIRVIHQSNQGLAGALNTGVKNMKGDWFKWFSPDDILYPDAIEVLVREAKTRPENTIVYSNWNLIDENGKMLRNFSESNYNNLGNFEFNVRLLDGQQINVNTTLIPSSLFDKGCMFQNLEDQVAVDYEFFLRAGMLYNVRFYHVHNSLVKYRVHSSQLSHKNIAKTLDYLPKIRNQILDKLDNKERTRYLASLETYQKQKPFAAKTMNFGLKLVKTLPAGLADELIVFYLNNIRRTR